MEGEEKERPLRSGTGVAVCGALAGTLTQRDQCVWLPHEEEDDINPLFLSEEPPLPRWYIPRYSGMNRWDCVEMGMIYMMGAVNLLHKRDVLSKYLLAHGE